MSRTRDALAKQAKKVVYDELKAVGFNDKEVREAVSKCGYDLRKCAKYLASRCEQKDLYAGMDVWYFSGEDRAWIHANIVSITRALVALIFKGNDFKWLEKDSEIFTTEEDRPDVVASDCGDDALVQHMTEATLPREDEMDYVVEFRKDKLGLKLVSDESGWGCIVNECISAFSTQNVIPSSLIVEVNGEWVAAQRFERIRDTLTRKAQTPPVTVKFRIQIEYLPKGEHWQRILEEAESGPRPEFRSAERRRAKRPKVDDLAEEKQAQPMRETDSIPGGEEPFVAHMDAASAERLQPGDSVDHRDDVGRYLLAIVSEKHGTRLKVHYEGWNPKWDVYSDYNQELFRFAAPKSISRQAQKKMLHVKVRDYIDINPVHRHCGWRFGQVRRVDKYSGQVQVVYKEGGAEYLYWVHLNNPEEAAPFMSKADETRRKVKRESVEEDSERRKKPPPPPPRRRGAPKKGERSAKAAHASDRRPLSADRSPKKKRGTSKWTCVVCGAANVPHRDFCMHCGTARVKR